MSAIPKMCINSRYLTLKELLADIMDLTAEQGSCYGLTLFLDCCLSVSYLAQLLKKQIHNTWDMFKFETAAMH